MVYETLHTMGTKMEFFLPSETDPTIWSEVRNELIKLDTVFNRFDPQSEVSGVNSGKAPVSYAMREAIALGVEYRLGTLGLFDVRYGGSYDFGGFAKGYALRNIRAILRSHDVKDAYVSLGNSSILALGNRPDGSPWTVELTDPFSDIAIETITLSDKCMSVSGNSPSYEGHIVNPVTGEPFLERAMVVAVADDPLDAEVLTTVACIADDEMMEEIESNYPEVSMKMYFV